MNRKLLLAVSLTALMFGAIFCASPAQASVTTNGKLSIAASLYIAGEPVFIGTDSLDASTAYYINITVDSTETSYGPWTTNSDGDPFTYVWEAENTASDPVVTIELCSPVGTAVDTKDITVQDTDDIIPLDLLVDIGITLFILFVIAGIVYKKR